MVRIFTCSCCRRKLPANPRVKNQRYCGQAACQRERKRRWQQARMATDPDYRDNQRDAQKSWRSRNPNYWRKRKAERRAPPPQHRASRPASPAVKMDTLSDNFIVETGEYIISPIGGADGKMDALRVKIIALSSV